MADERNMNQDECTHDCSSCGASGGCPSADPASFLEAPNAFSSIKHVIGVVSGKGGVGKSFVTASLAVELSKQGYKVGVLDADITGPSIQKMFGLEGNIRGSEQGLIPKETANGVEVMSINFLLEDPTMPVIWRGPMIADVVKQFWTEVMWGELDYLLVDMPPGTGDVPLTVFQSLPVDGVVIVTSPQSLVNMIVKKAYNMAKDMNIPVLGMIENYSYLECPDCGKKMEIFGKSTVDEIAGEIGVPVLGKLPIMPEMAAQADKGQFEFAENKHIADAVSALVNL